MKQGLKFREWVAEKYEESIDDANEWVASLQVADQHFGDCNRKPISCRLCTLLDILQEYTKYCEEHKMIR